VCAQKEIVEKRRGFLEFVELEEQTDLLGGDEMDLYLIALSIGLMYVLLTIVFGDLVDFGWEGMPFLSPTTLFTFLIIFGGVGTYVQDHYHLSAWKLMSLSIVIGFVVSTIIAIVVVIPLKKADVTAGFTSNDLIDQMGTLSAICSHEVLGEVVVSYKGTKIAYPCKHVNEGTLSIGTTVLLTKRDEHYFLVKELVE
jgi:hypothetical protein